MAADAGGDLSAEPTTEESLGARVGTRIRQRRLELDRKLAEVAASADLSVGYLSSIEKGGKVPSLPVLARLAHALEMSLAEILRTSASSRAVPRLADQPARSGAPQRGGLAATDRPSLGQARLARQGPARVRPRRRVRLRPPGRVRDRRRRERVRSRSRRRAARRPAAVDDVARHRRSDRDERLGSSGDAEAERSGGRALSGGTGQRGVVVEREHAGCCRVSPRARARRQAHKLLVVRTAILVSTMFADCSSTDADRAAIPPPGASPGRRALDKQSFTAASRRCESRHVLDPCVRDSAADDEERSRESTASMRSSSGDRARRRTRLLTADGSVSKHRRLSLSRPSGHPPRRRAHCSVGRPGGATNRPLCTPAAAGSTRRSKTAVLRSRCGSASQDARHAAAVGAHEGATDRPPRRCHRRY